MGYHDSYFMIHNSIQKTETTLFGIAFVYRFLIFTTLLWWSGQAGFEYPLLGSDARGYWNLAHNIVAQQEFYIEDERFIAIRRPPGYPLFIAAFQSLPLEEKTAQYIVSMLQILLAALSVALLYRLMRQITAEKIARGAALFFALEPNSAYYSTLLLSDALFVFLLLVFVYVFLTKESRSASFWASILLGLSMLVRPIAQFFPAVAILFLLYTRSFRRETIVRSAAFCIGVLLFTLPWMIHNQHVAGSFDISSSGPNTYYRYVMPSFVAWRTGKPHAAIQEQFIAQFDAAVANKINAVTFMQEETSRIISEAPASYAFYHIVKTVPFFLGDGIREILQKTELLHIKQPNISSELLHGNITKVIGLAAYNKYLLLAVFGSIFWSIVFILAAIGFWDALHQDDKKRRYAIFFATIILYLAILTGPATSTRHRMPALPFIAALAAMGAASFAHKYKII
ncbi:MAG: hypothetical protein G01um101470_466 [Parcubacteria group bacterium Gr01-1014_70]|nr:MAG: hypothetical protein G01um101470_466 [Parcubacteria group bacterium Gr01-1014_70]